MSFKTQHMQDAFLFAAPAPSLNVPSTARKVHLRRLYDILQLCIHRDDLPRARRAWSILIRCKEINWMAMWGIAIHLIEENPYEDHDSTRKIELLRDMILHYPDERVALIKELVFRLIFAGRHREALDELELYLPSFPYQDNPVLHVYAGLLCFYLFQGNNGTDKPAVVQPNLVREAVSHFERARVLDPGNIVAVSFIQKIAIQNLETNIQATQLAESDDDLMVQNDDDPPKPKRLRQTMSSP